MTTYEVRELFSKHSDEEYLEFERVPQKLSQRPDLHAFLLLESLFPRDRDMVRSARHGQFWLDVDIDEFAPVATEPLIVELLRCGISLFDSDSLLTSMV
jgi:hypothetical protein